MKRSRFGVSTRLLALVAIVAAAGLAAPASLFAGTRASDDALSLVPAGLFGVGQHAVSLIATDSHGMSSASESIAGATWVASFASGVLPPQPK